MDLSEAEKKLIEKEYGFKVGLVLLRWSRSANFYRITLSDRLGGQADPARPSETSGGQSDPMGGQADPARPWLIKVQDEDSRAYREWLVASIFQKLRDNPVTSKDPILKLFMPLIPMKLDRDRCMIAMPEYPKTLDEAKTLDEETALICFVRLEITLVLLHNCDIVHLDVKPSNIFLDEDDNVFLGDFDCSEHISSSASSSAEDADTCTYHHSTRSYVCQDVKIPSNHAYLVDFLGLVVSILECMRLLYPNGNLTVPRLKKIIEDNIKSEKLKKKLTFICDKALFFQDPETGGQRGVGQASRWVSQASRGVKRRRVSV